MYSGRLLAANSLHVVDRKTRRVESADRAFTVRDKNSGCQTAPKAKDGMEMEPRHEMARLRATRIESRVILTRTG